MLPWAPIQTVQTAPPHANNGWRAVNDARRPSFAAIRGVSATHQGDIELLLRPIVGASVRHHLAWQTAPLQWRQQSHPEQAAAQRLTGTPLQFCLKYGHGNLATSSRG